MDTFLQYFKLITFNILDTEQLALLNSQTVPQALQLGLSFKIPYLDFQRPVLGWLPAERQATAGVVKLSSSRTDCYLYWGKTLCLQVQINISTILI